MKTQKLSGLAIRSNVKAGGIPFMHNRAGLKVERSVKAGLRGPNHNRGVIG